jgi:hypothetical protein
MQTTHNPSALLPLVAPARPRLLTLALSLLTALSCAACGSSALTTQDLEAMRLEVKSKESEIKAQSAAVETKEDYQSFISTNEGSAILIGPEALTQAIKQMLPYPFQGNELMKGMLSGDFEVLSVHNFSILPGNQARLTLKFKGENIKVTVPSKYKAFVSKKDVSAMKKALTGGELDIVVSAYLSPKDGALILKPRCTDGRFKANLGSRKGDVMNGINRKLMRKKKLKLGAPLSASSRLLTTPNHLVILPR